MALSRTAHGSLLPGQILAKASYVFRPINIASQASSRPSPSRKYASSRKLIAPQPCGFSKTPSAETSVYSISLRMRWLPFSQDVTTWRRLLRVAGALVVVAGARVRPDGNDDERVRSAFARDEGRSRAGLTV